MNADDELDEKESYLVLAHIYQDDKEIAETPCRVYLPRRIYEKPKIVLKPDKKHANKIKNIWKTRLYSETSGSPGTTKRIIEVPELYSVSSTTRYWGSNLSETTIFCSPQNLCIIDIHDTSKNATEAHVNFLITNNSFLTPSYIRESSYNGNLKHKKINNIKYELDDIDVEFERHFKGKIDDNEVFTQWSYLVATCKIDFSARESNKIREKYLQNLDDFLLLTSFSCRQRTACLGWEAQDITSTIKYYRGNFTFPEPSKTDINNTLIDINESKNFLDSCFRFFGSYKNKLPLRNSLQSIVASSEGNMVLEQEFLANFSALESLILEFRRSEELEFILQEHEWRPLKSCIEKSIKDFDSPKIDAKTRSRLYAKLSEINRLSLREAYDLFCSEYAIPTRDLWAVFGDKEHAGLSEIRNRLIHGDPFPHTLIDSLANANAHLRILVERSLLRFMGWNIARSTVSPSFVSIHLLCMIDIDIHRKRLKEYIVNS